MALDYRFRPHRPGGKVALARKASATDPLHKTKSWQRRQDENERIWALWDGDKSSAT